MTVTQYIGARYVPVFADPVEHDENKAYEPLTIVTHKGDSYTSKQAVPTGIEIHNSKYWVRTSKFSQQIEEYRNEVREEQTRAINKENELDAKIEKETNDRKEAVLNLENKINTSVKSDLTALKNELNNKIETETSNRTNADAVLKQEISKNSSNIEIANNKIEEAHTQHVQIQNRLSELDTELHDEIDTARQNEHTLTTNLNAEIERAKEKENELNTKIQTNSDEIEKLKGSGTGSLGDLETKIENEKTRAENEEQTLHTLIESNEEALNSEIERAKNRENEIERKISATGKRIWTTNKTVNLTVAGGYAGIGNIDELTNQELHSVNAVIVATNGDQNATGVFPVGTRINPTTRWVEVGLSDASFTGNIRFHIAVIEL